MKKTITKFLEAVFTSMTLEDWNYSLKTIETPYLTGITATVVQCYID
jgi:hypothetical protein